MRIKISLKKGNNLHKITVGTITLPEAVIELEGESSEVTPFLDMFIKEWGRDNGKVHNEGC